ncbi:MAG: hypothetical protein BJ554DRAFT_3515, partial [Olpidium bornovanus]
MALQPPTPYKLFVVGGNAFVWDAAGSRSSGVRPPDFPRTNSRPFPPAAFCPRRALGAARSFPGFWGSAVRFSAGRELPASRRRSAIPLSTTPHLFLLVAIALRSHRIVGSLVGSLPRAPQQNVFLGLPLLLLEEEVNVLVEEGLAVLVDDSAACSHRLSSEDLLAFEREVRAHLRKVEAEAEDRRRDLEKAGRERNAVSCEAGAPEGGGGGGGGMSKKKMKRLARQLEKLHPRPALAEAVGLCPAAEEADLPACASEPDASSNGRDAGDRAPGGGAPPPPTAPAAKSLRAPLRRRAGEFCPWRAAAESAVSCGTLAAARRLGLWTFPRTERDRARLD